MALIKKNEFKQMNINQLEEKLIDLKKGLMKVNAQVSIGSTPENPGKIKEIKKTIAKINTIIKLKQKEDIKKVNE